MSDTAAGLLTVLALVVVLGVTHVPLGDYMARVYSATTHWRAERVALPAVPDRPGRRPDLGDVRRVGARLLAGLGAVPVRPASGCSTCCRCRSGYDGGRAAPGLEHRGVVRDQHQLAELLRRVDHGLPGPDGRPRGAELRLRRGRHRRRRRAGARLRPVADQPGRQLLGRPGPRLRPDPAAAGGRRRRSS